MSFDIVVAIKQLGRLSKAIKDAESNLKTFHTPGAVESDPFAQGTCLVEIKRAVDVLREAPAVLSDLDMWHNQTMANVKQAQEHFKTTLAAELAQKVADAGYTLEGRIPELRVALLTIELLLGDGLARIWYGPKTELLDKVALNAAILSNTITTHLRTLAAEPLDECQFLRDLLKAWQLARLRTNAAESDPTLVPVGAILAELTLVRQPRTFWLNPNRATFVNYGRVQFSYDMCRLTTRVVDGMECKLTVATRDQTKMPHTSLWIPRTVHGEGTHFSAISFRPIQRDE